MSSLSHLYTDFTGFTPGAFDATAIGDDALENAQLTGFESGYQAGWEDAVKAKDDEEGKLTSDFVQCVQDMSFSYHEAFAKLSTGMRPLMSRFVTSVLPAVAQEGLHLQLVDQIQTLIDAQAENAIEIAVSPERVSSVETILESQVAIPFAIAAEPSLSDGQVYLRVNQEEREIDIDAVLAEVTQAVEAYFHTSEPELKHG